MASTAVKLLSLDCDSTLSAIEGIDELARLRGPECYAAVEQMTREAMDGRISLDEIFARRLDMIRPRRAEAEAIGRMYVRTVEPTARATLQAARAAGWTPVIVSGGYSQVIAPLAEHLGITRIEAVPLRFDAQGNYAGFDATHPAGHRGGKTEILRALRTELKPARVVAVGDGVSDLDVRDEVDLFIGFGRYAVRAAVKAGAHRYVHSLDEIIPLLA